MAPEAAASQDFLGFHEVIGVDRGRVAAPLFEVSDSEALGECGGSLLKIHVIK